MEAKGRREIDCERRKRAGERREKERRNGDQPKKKKSQQGFRPKTQVNDFTKVSMTKKAMCMPRRQF